MAPVPLQTASLPRLLPLLDVANDVRRLGKEFPVARGQFPVLESGNWRLGISLRPGLVTSSATVEADDVRGL
jgi:hypothetical protein